MRASGILPDYRSARRLRPVLYGRFIGGIGRDTLQGVDEWDLLAVADAVAAADPAGTELLQDALTGFPFDRADPNYGHRVIALLFAEKLIAIALTLNYDSCIERAAYRFSLTIQVCRRASDMQLGRDKGRLVKLHGCISDASTMLITSEQLVRPSEWALAEVMAAVAEDAVVIVGIGSVAPYMRHTLEQVRDYAARAQSVWIVAPTIDDASWDAMLGAGNRAHKVPVPSEKFFDDVLRACIGRQLGELRRRATEMDDAASATLGSGGTYSLAATRLIGVLDRCTAEDLTLYFRKSATLSDVPAAYATSEVTVRALVALALIQEALGATAEVARIADEVSIRVGDVYIEFALLHQPHTGSEVSRRIEDRLIAVRGEASLPDLSKPVLVLAYGHLGRLPSNGAPGDIVGPTLGDSLINGPEALDVRWLDLRDITNAGDLDDVRRKVVGAIT